MDIEPMITTDRSAKWAKYYENQKQVWYDPNIHWAVKAVIRLVELHRSDSQGWSLSVRKIAGHLGISPNTALKAIRIALTVGYLEASRTIPRKRRKLRLSVSLRAPVEHEIANNPNLSQWKEQPVSPAGTDSVSPTASVNIKRISNTNIEDLDLKEETKEIAPYRESEAYRKFIKRRKELGL